MRILLGRCVGALKRHGRDLGIGTAHSFRDLFDFMPDRIPCGEITLEI
jgi:hypothetical protein